MGLPGTVPRKVFIKFLATLGIVYMRAKGGHKVYDNPNHPLKRPIIIQSRGKEIPRMHIQSNLSTIGVDTKVFLEFLKNN